MAALTRDTVDGLWLLHWPKMPGRTDTPRPAVPGDGAFVLETCQRHLALGLLPGPAAPPATAPAGGELRFGAEAYRFALEVATGLRSAVAGEAQVFGQFRQAWREQSGKAGLGALGRVVQSLFADTRAIRREHLQGLGGLSYGRLARRLLRPRPGERLLIVGAGTLAGSLVPAFPGQALATWSRRGKMHPALRAAGIQHYVGPDEADGAARAADLLLLATPADESHDQAWARRLAASPIRAALHLGRRREAGAGVPPQAAPQFPWLDLDDLFALARTEARERGHRLEQARAACRNRPR